MFTVTKFKGGLTVMASGRGGGNLMIFTHIVIMIIAIGG